MSAPLYNTLTSVEDADKKFVNRDEIFSKLSTLFRKYNNKWGLCLVHRHCLLEDGELMVATGNVSQPERGAIIYPEPGFNCYPERWLADGRPYEFSREPTISPPSTLLVEFQEIVRHIDVLGLQYMPQDFDPREISFETTDGRKNVVTSVVRPTIVGWHPEAVWGHSQ